MAHKACRAVRILTALQAIPTNVPTATLYKQMVQAAVYLIGSSSQYQVVR